MTNLEAIQSYLEPYELSENKLELLLDEQGLQSSDDYVRTENRVSMIKAVIEALHSCMTLTEESDNGSKQKYDVAALENLIRHYKRSIGDDSEEKKSLVRDATRQGIW